MKDQGKVRYTSTKSTQTDVAESPIKAPTTSTPAQATPKLQRRRSLSVGSSPIGPASGNVATSNAKTNLFASGNVATSNAKGNLCASGNVATSSDNANPCPSGKSMDVIEYRGKQYPKALIDVCAEFARQEEQEKREHEKNKKQGRYHLCPKLNFESTSSSIQNVTDFSCTSTCACSKSTAADSNKSSQDDSRDDSDHTRASTFLHLSLSDDEETSGGEKQREETHLGTKADNGTSTAATTDTVGEDVATSSASAPAAYGQDGRYPDEYQPNYYTQVRSASCPMSEENKAALKLVRHIRDVNASRADLDITLLPKGACLVYSPKSNTISVETSTEDFEIDCPASPGPPKNKKARKNEAIEPKNFYSSMPPSPDPKQ